jgi:carbamoyltransferase
MAGGVALNCVANGKLTKHEIFSNIYVQPASGDAGGSIGSALAAHYIYFGLKRKPDTSNDEMSGSYLGPEFSEKEIQLMNKTTKAVFKKYDNINDLTDFVASKLSSGNVIGWFQGRMEFGPRSLGNRSILGDARNINMHQKLNLKIKYREGFRPFASSVLFENLSDYFDTKTSSPYMLFTSSIKDEYRRILPDNYYDLSPIERINYNRSEFQSVIHVDFSSRIQTVHKETNYRYWNLLNAFKKMTNCGILINTSFNIRGEPIVCTPFDAYRCFMSTEMDYLVIGDFIYFKKEQSDWNVKSKWLVNYNKD